MGTVLNLKDYKKRKIKNNKEGKEPQVSKNKYLEAWKNTTIIEKIMIQDSLDN